MRLPLISLSPSTAHPHGATLAQDQFATVLPALKSYRDEDGVFVLNCAGVLSITASFIRGTLYRAFLCAQAEMRQTPSDPNSEIIPLKLYPVVTGCNSEVRDAIHEFFVGRNAPIMEVSLEQERIAGKGYLLGALDPILRRTLTKLLTVGEATAADLAGQSRESISINGWNNRLADLLILRLVTRRRQGKFWHYSPLLKEIASWV